MHGLVLGSVQVFMVYRHGASSWVRVAERAGLSSRDFEPMLVYPDEVGKAVFAALPAEVQMPLSDILEDIGTFLVSQPLTEAVRRLLRFGGVSFDEFLHSLDDLPDRVRLAVPDLHLPEIRVNEVSPGCFKLTCRGEIAGFGHVLTGVLRTMADDYGALVLVEHGGASKGVETLRVDLLEATFARGRDFSLRGSLT